MLKVLVTGAGGAAAVSLLRRFAELDDVALHAADIDPCAAGLFLVPPSRRHLVRRGDDPSFVDDLGALCAQQRIDVLIPTVDGELAQVAEAREGFEARGTQVAVAPLDALRRCLDKAALMEAVEGDPAAPTSWVLDAALDLEVVPLPVIAKPRTGSGGRGIELVEDLATLAALPRDGSLLLQEHLPGDEYSVDVFVDRRGRVIAAVPRLRAKVDSGVAVAGRTLRDAELEEAAARIATAVGIRGVANVQLKRDADDRPKLLEINPRFPGTMPLTVAAGADIPWMVLADLLRLPVPQERVPFAEIGMVRTWQETFVTVAEMESVGRGDVVAPRESAFRLLATVRPPALA